MARRARHTTGRQAGKLRQAWCFLLARPPSHPSQNSLNRSPTPLAQALVINCTWVVSLSTAFTLTSTRRLAFSPRRTRQSRSEHLCRRHRNVKNGKIVDLTGRPTGKRVGGGAPQKRPLNSRSVSLMSMRRPAPVHGATCSVFPAVEPEPSTLTLVLGTLPYFSDSLRQQVLL